MKSFKLIAVLFMAVQSIAAHAQNKFIEGYVVTSASDTIRGFIFDKYLDKKTKTIQFKKQLDSPETTVYSPLEVRAFYIKAYNEYFFGHVLDIDVKPDQINELESNPAARFKKDTVFLKLLVKGKANLYTYRDTFKEHFFYQIDNGSPKELIYIVYKPIGKGPAVVEFYKTQLKELFADCATMKSFQTPFIQANLQKIFQTYNNCVGQGSVYTQVTKRKVAISALGGVSYLSGHFTGDDRALSYQSLSYSEMASYNTSTSPYLGIALQFVSRKPSNPVSIGFESFFRQTAYSGSVTQNSRLVTIDFKWSTIRLNALIKYTFINNKFMPYIKAGVTSGLAISETNYEKNVSSGTVYYEGKAADFSGMDLGFVGGVGLPITKKSWIELRYETASKSAPSAKFIASGFSAQVGYRFVN